MKYLSPFYILPEGFEIGSLNDKKSLKKARKLVLAEFELLGKTTIIVNGQELDKNAVLNYFEALEKDSNLNFHIEIFQNKPLLSFLENGLIKDYQAATNSILNYQYQQEENNSFIDFVAPYITSHFSDLFTKAIRQKDLKTFDILIEKEFPLPQKYEVNAYQSVYRWYHSKLRNVEQIEASLHQRKFISSKDIKALIDRNFINIFNRLPMYFHNVRDRYAFQLYQIVVVLNNDLKRISLAREIVDVGLHIKADYSTLQYFKEANKVIDHDVKQEGKFNWIWLFLIFQGIMIISRIATCNNASTINTTNFNSSDINYILKDPLDDSNLYWETDKSMDDKIKENQIKMDSLMKLLNSKGY